MRTDSPTVTMLACLALVLAGCGPHVERSQQAAPLPAAASNEATSSFEKSSLDNWPGWRGNNASGIADGIPLPSDLAASTAWSVASQGTGNSSPVVWGDYIFLTAESGAASQLAVQCFHRGDGRLVWQEVVAPIAGGTHVKNGHASASIATDGQRLFAFFGSAGLFAFDLEGQQLWHRDLGEMEHRWGTASSPMLFGDLVIQLCDRKANSYLAAFRQDDGEPVWRTDRDSTGCWTTPVLYQTDDEPQLIVNGSGEERGGSGAITAYDPRDGRELWRVSGTTHVVCPTAILGAGLIVSSSGRNGPIFALRPAQGDPTAEPEVQWRARRGGPYVPTGVAYRNRLYLINDGGVLTCYNLGDGEKIWEQRTHGPVTASLVAGDGKLYCVSEQGDVSVVAADDEFRVLAEHSLNQRSLSTPAISQGQIFIRTENQLHAFGERQSVASPATQSSSEAESK